MPRWLRPLLVALLLPLSWAGMAEAADWTGTWNSTFRDGQALLELTQTGDQVEGIYRPGNGRISGTVDGATLSGSWRDDNASGDLVFILSRGGNSFLGRYGSDEYWNGVRADPDAPPPTPFTRADTPVEALKTILTALNATYAGDGVAALIWEPLLVYQGEQGTAPAQRLRRNLLYELMNMSTFSTAWADAYLDGDRTAIAIGPIDSDWRFDLVLERGGDGLWRLLVPPLDELVALRAEAIAALGYETRDEYLAARTVGPRQTMRAFLDGAHTWYEGGEARARATLDLSLLPPYLVEVEGEIIADYLLQVLNRVGYVIWQELPDDPEQRLPYVHFSYPAGRIVIERSETEAGTTLWRFSSETVRTLPALYEAVQELPYAAGLGPTEPFSDAFRMRQRMLAVSPVLVERWLVFENWQWLALIAGLLATVVAFWITGLVARALAGLPALGWLTAFVWPVRLIIAGALIGYLVDVGGFRSDVAAVLGAVGVLVLIVGSAGVFYQITDRGLRSIAEHVLKAGSSDDIVVSLLVGITKVGVVLTAIFVAARSLGLPYEGVLAGLGVGGLALAFAGRETVSNVLGAVILLADRPFKKGDLVEFGGTMATVEEVGLRSTRLRTLEDSQLIVPNSRLSDDTVNNLGRRRNRRIVMQVGLTYDTPRALLDTFVERLLSIVGEHPDSEPSTFYVGLQGFGPSSIDIELRGFFRTPAYADFVKAQHKLVGDIVSLADELGASFAFPTRTVHVVSAGESPPARAGALEPESAG